MKMPFVAEAEAALPEVAKTLKVLLASYDTASEKFKDYQKDNVKMMCRWLEKLMIPHISKAAQAKAIKLGLGEHALRKANWSNQEKTLTDKKRKIFHLEHVRPVSQLRDEIIAARDKPIERILEILRSAEIAWILKDEDKELTKRKFRKNRPDPREAYALCGIEIVDW